jgi:hypothetical protein
MLASWVLRRIVCYITWPLLHVPSSTSLLCDTDRVALDRAGIMLVGLLSHQNREPNKLLFFIHHPALKIFVIITQNRLRQWHVSSNWCINSMHSMLNLARFSFWIFRKKNSKPVLKFMWKCKEPRWSKTRLKIKNKVGGFTLHNFKT